MGDEQGYDDQFDDGVFRSTLHASARQRPCMWPRSVSEMRNHTTYWWQGMPAGHDTGYSDHVTRGRCPQAQHQGHHPQHLDRPFWNEPGHPRNNPRYNPGYSGHAYYDPARGGWVNIDSYTR
jgi:hypothetical protein